MASSQAFSDAYVMARKNSVTFAIGLSVLGRLSAGDAMAVANLVAVSAGAEAWVTLVLDSPGFAVGRGAD